MIEQLSEIIESRGLNMADVAKMIKVPNSTVTRIFSKKTNPKLKTLVDICQALEVEIKIVPHETTCNNS